MQRSHTPCAHSGGFARFILIGLVGLIGVGAALTERDAITVEVTPLRRSMPESRAADAVHDADRLHAPSRIRRVAAPGPIERGTSVPHFTRRADEEHGDVPPERRFSTYLGGRAIDLASALTIDRKGYVYVAGQTFSDDFPTRRPAQAYQGGSLVGTDAFVAKFSPNGDSLIYATYLGGGMGEELVAAMAVDAEGRVYVAGTTTSMDFPTQNPIHGFRPGPQAFSDAFVVRLAADGSRIDMATYLGGMGDETVTALVLGDDGSVYVAGSTTSTDFPTTAGVTQTMRPEDAAPSSLDGFVARLSPVSNRLHLDYATYLGGTRDDIPNALAIDAAGRVWVAGGTTSIDFPTRNALQSTFAGPIRDLEGDAFVARLSADATALDVATYLGGSQDDQVTGLALDAEGRVVLTGTTMSSDFPTTPNAYQPSRQGLRERFVAWLEPTGNSWSLAASTRLGAPGGFVTGRTGLAVDRAGRVWIAGATASDQFPTQNAAQSVYGGGANDAFVARLDATGRTLGYATYLGGLEADVVTSLAVSDDALCLAGSTGSTDFPMQAALQSTFDGPSTADQGLTSAFVTCFDVGPRTPRSVELTAFEGRIDAGAALLTWTTASETGNTGFDIQWRTANEDGPWTPLAFVEGAGTTTDPQSYQYRVHSLPSGAYRFRLKQISVDGAVTFSPEVEVRLDVPERFALHGAYPNPSHGMATIPFDVAEAAAVRLTVYDVLGRKQAVLIDQEYAPGRYEVSYDGRRWASGMYFLAIEMGAFRDVKKVLLLH